MLVESTMMQLGAEAPDLSLPDTQGNIVSRDDFRGHKALLVVFMCNHCPYVKHLRDHFAHFAREYQEKGVAIIGINSNDAAAYPDDSPEKMVEEAAAAGYTFPYLFDESQDVAKSYRAACTPDFFLFDHDFRLVYRGQYDASRPKSETAPTGQDLRVAIEAVLHAEPVPADQRPSSGCNIKWKPGSQPDYFG